MGKQLISISPDGEVSGLQFKRGRGLDLRSLGKAKIERSSLIEWHEELQKWYLRILSDNAVVTNGYLKDQGVSGIWQDLSPDLIWPESDTCHWLLWDDYEDAVSAEVQLIQEIRKKKGVNAV